MDETMQAPGDRVPDATAEEVAAMIALPPVPHPADPRVAVAMEVLRIGAESQHNLTSACRDAACEVLIAALYQRPIDTFPHLGEGSAT